jgi:hypothetical protein
LNAEERIVGFSVQLHLPPSALVFLVGDTVVGLGSHKPKIKSV